MIDPAMLSEIAQAVANQARVAAELYGEVLKRLGVDELRAVWALIQADKRRSARGILLAAMTPDELTADKRLATDAAVKLADDAAEAREIAGELGWAVLKAVAGAVIAAAVI